MIVVDSNVLAYLYLPSEFTASAELLLAKEPHWAAPTLWRSEFRNVLALYMRKKLLTLDEAYIIYTEAESLLAGSEFETPTLDVLRLIETSECSAYDCEFVSLAQQQKTVLVTQDKKVLKQFPKIAFPISHFTG
jgi:predicted nucleic acid-binding protein